MAVVNTKSTLVTNLDASPQVRQQVAKSHGRQRITSDYVSVAAADDNASTYRVVRVHSSWVIHSIKCITTAITAGTDYDCGLYRTAEDGAAVVDADCYADGFSVATAAPAVPPTADAGSPIELRFGAATTANPLDVTQQVWQDAGLTSDPGVWYDLVLTANTVGTAAGDIALIVGYTAGD